MNPHGHDSDISHKRFTRLFPELPAATFRKNILMALADTMILEDGEKSPSSKIPAGYTYFGQFVDHDLTRDSAGDEIASPIPANVLPIQLATPSLDLDSLYGPRGEYLNQDGVFTMKATVENLEPSRAELERSLNGRARIADPRNEDNLAVMHFHILFQQFHNKIYETTSTELPTIKRAEVAMIETIHYYQHLVLYDFLKKILDPDVYKAVIENDDCVIYRTEPSEVPLMPLEFSGAAFRFGHSMVREFYNWNKHFKKVENTRLLKNTGIGGHLGDINRHNNAWYIDWDRFIPESNKKSSNHAKAINTVLASSLGKLPHSGGGNLAYRNMARGVSYGLPSGQAVGNQLASKMNLKEPLTTSVIVSASHSRQKEILEAEGLHKNTPLWYYLLLEAEICREGECLGQIGSQIVAEVFLNIVRCSKQSILRTEFNPEEGALSKMIKKGDNLTLRHIIDYV